MQPLTLKKGRVEGNGSQPVKVSTPCSWWDLRGHLEEGRQRGPRVPPSSLPPRPTWWLQSSVFVPPQPGPHDASGRSEPLSSGLLPPGTLLSSLDFPLKTCTGTHLRPSLEDEATSDLLASLGPSRWSCWPAWPFQVPVPVHLVHHLCVHVSISLPGFWPSSPLGPVTLSAGP